mmetsp:Transcript_15821/g.48017  ORF Transcript_15821/g.48017 Transcript_15821/m.48017 type:complete len:96 (-) Transcript_15821:30-317(-)
MTLRMYLEALRTPMRAGMSELSLIPRFCTAVGAAPGPIFIGLVLLPFLSHLQSFHLVAMRARDESHASRARAPRMHVRAGSHHARWSFLVWVGAS